MKIKVLSDSTCDLSKDLLEQYNISTIPLTVIKDGQAFSDGININVDEIFSHVDAGGDLCTTTAINASEYQQWFSKYADDYDGVIHISLSSELSSSYQNACIAAGEFENVRVVDSKNLSTGQGLVAIKACELISECDNLDILQAKVQEFTSKVESSFLLDRLDYMVKGGRCSAAVALGANLLNLKPCIEVKDGKLSVVKKYRGSYPKCLATYIKDRLSDRSDIDENILFVTRTPVSNECIDAVSSAVNEYSVFKNVYWTNAGSTISCHCGPGTLGVLFVRK